MMVVLPHTVVDNADNSPTRLTAGETLLILPYLDGGLPSPHFKQRGLLWPFMRSCSCSWSASCSLWRGLGVFAGSLFGFPPHEEGPSARRSIVCSSPAPRTHGMRNEFDLSSRTGVRACFMALTCARCQ